MKNDSAPAHANNIDALRLILSLLVMFSHCYALGFGVARSDEPLARWSGGAISFGELAVDWFFVLSGYLIAQSYERSRSGWSFLRKRAARIYPGFLVAAILSVVMVAPLGTPGMRWVSSGPLLWRNIGRILLLQQPETPGVFPAVPLPGLVNGSLWTISFEFLCYLGVLGLGLTATLRHRWSVLSLFAVALALGYGFLLGHYTSNGGLLGRLVGRPADWSRLLPCYLSGVVAYLFRDSLRWSWAGAALSLAGLAVSTRLPSGLTLTLPILGTYLVLYLAFTTDWRWHSAARHGDFSYGIYLYAWPIQQIIMDKFVPRASPLHLFALAVGPCILAGMASWFLVERWFTRKASKPSAGDF